MNKRMRTLLTTDLLQTSRQSQATSGGKTTRYTAKSIYVWLFIQNIAMAVVFSLMYSWLFIQIPLPSFPGLYTNYLLMMSSFVLLQLFYQLFSVFFDTQELNQYLALPFSLVELFISKLISVVLSVVGMMVPVVILMVILGQQMGHSLFWVIPFAIGAAILLLATIISVEMIVFSLISRTQFFQRHRRIVGTGLYLISVIVMVGMIMLGSQNDPTEGLIVDKQVIHLFYPFFQIFVKGELGQAALGILAWIAVCVATWVVVIKRVIPHLYGQGSENTQLTTPKKESHRERVNADLPSFSRWFVRYQFRQMADTSFIMQMFFAKLYIPLIMFLPMLTTQRDMSLAGLSFGKASGLFILYGFLFSLMTMSNVSISGVSMSLDRENFNYFKALPLSFSQYLKRKLRLAMLIEWLPGLIIILAVGIFVHLSPLYLLLVTAGYTLGILMQAYFYFIRDYQNLNLNWTSIQELSQRGLHQGIRVVLFFILIFVGMFGVMALTFYVLSRPEWLQLTISVLIPLILLALCGTVHWYGQKKLWSEID